MTEQTSQAATIIDLWPGDSRPDRRKAMAKSLDYPDEKVRYWEKAGEIPQREWQHCLDVAARDGIPLMKYHFVLHLTEQPEDAAPASDAA